VVGERSSIRARQLLLELFMKAIKVMICKLQFPTVTICNRNNFLGSKGEELLETYPRGDWMMDAIYNPHSELRDPNV